MATTIVAKLAGRSRNGDDYRKLLTTNRTVFDLPEKLKQAYEYSPETILPEDEWFVLKNFSKKPYFLSILETDSFSSSNYKSIEPADFGKIEFILSKHNGYSYIQRITKTRQIRQKGFLFIGNEVEYKDDMVLISINTLPDAIYSEKEDSLYFQRLNSLTAVFKGIEILYREATKDEVNSFLSLPILTLEENYTSEKVGISNRKRIAMAIDILNKFSDDQKNDLFSYVRSYCPHISTDDGFTIKSEKCLKEFLYGIEQRYYTTLIGEEKRLANSIIQLNR